MLRAVQKQMIKMELPGHGLDAVLMLLHGVEISVAQRGGIQTQARATFQADELRGFAKREMQFRRIEHLQGDEVVTAVTKARQATLERIGIVEQITDQNQQTALREFGEIGRAHV